jgi:hypothetical protein
MSDSRKFAGWLALEMIKRSITLQDLTLEQDTELEHLLLTAFYAGLKYDPAVNKIPEGQQDEVRKPV